MFWNKKVKVDLYRGMMFGHMIAEDEKGQVRLASIEEVRDVESKVDLLLAELGKVYVPGTEEEPAYLADKLEPVTGGDLPTRTALKLKKRGPGRPKGSKNKKK